MKGVTFFPLNQVAKGRFHPNKGKDMARLALATDPGGVVISLLAQHPSTLPVLCNECTDRELAKKIPAFEANTLSQRERAQVINHAKKCRPCRNELGWGEL
jgi:Putative zinc-finger